MKTDEEIMRACWIQYEMEHPEQAVRVDTECRTAPLASEFSTSKPYDNGIGDAIWEMEKRARASKM